MVIIFTAPKAATIYDGLATKGDYEMARALTGYGEYHATAEHLARRVPRTHPEKMARAAGVLMETQKADEEALESDDTRPATMRRLGTKALQGTAT